MIRYPAVAGSFYPGKRSSLVHELNRLMPEDVEARPARGIIVPHAGYIYSGEVAGELIATTRIPKTVVLLGPNHHGTGYDVAVSGAEQWRTPLGDVPLSARLRDLICSQVAGVEIDDRAHQFEHSLEVMLPFLLRQQPELQILPISIHFLSLEDALALGVALAGVIAPLAEDILLLASSDMNHFLDAETTHKLDNMAIAAMTAFDPEALYRTVKEHRISMCGVLPAVIVMKAAEVLGAKTCRLVRYAHSGLVNGDNNRVVGYAGLRIE